MLTAYVLYAQGIQNFHSEIPKIQVRNTCSQILLEKDVFGKTKVGCNERKIHNLKSRGIVLNISLLIHKIHSLIIDSKT